MGCEALYLNTGWDTNFGSKIWDEACLGAGSEFTAWLKDENGLSLSFHVPLSCWSNPSSFSEEMLRLNAEGKRVESSPRGASRQYQDETFRRLLKLARREEYVAAQTRIVRRVHASYPEVQFGTHEQVTGGSRQRYVPIYYAYGSVGYENVWVLNSCGTRCAISSAATVWHFKEGLMFSRNASTFLHLGIGGSHAEEAVRDMRRKPVLTYMRLKPFFNAGTFYGIDEVNNVHRHPILSAAVVNCFNLTDQPFVRGAASTRPGTTWRPGSNI